MRLLTILATFLFLASCASNQQDKKEVREPASAVNPCKIEKHDKKNWYRLTVNGEPAYNSWYTKSQADGHYATYAKKGVCSQD